MKKPAAIHMPQYPRMILHRLMAAVIQVIAARRLLLYKMVLIIRYTGITRVQAGLFAYHHRRYTILKMRRSIIDQIRPTIRRPII